MFGGALESEGVYLKTGNISRTFPIYSENSCGTCWMEVGNNQNGLNCEICSCWYDSACAGVSAEEHKLMMKPTCMPLYDDIDVRWLLGFN